MTLRHLGVLAVQVIMGVSTCLGGSNVWIVRPEGVGPVKVGMSLSQLNATLHETFSLPEDKEEQGCFFVNPAAHRDIAFMIINGRLARVEVGTPGVSTSEGIHIGDSEAHALRVYGPRLKVAPHAYTGPEGHYLTIRSGDGRYGTRFETDAGKIVRFYAGRYSAILYIEGCQ